MTDPILYISLLLGLAGIYTLISAFGDDDDDNGGDGEVFSFDFDYLNLLPRLLIHSFQVSLE